MLAADVARGVQSGVARGTAHKDAAVRGAARTAGAHDGRLCVHGYHPTREADAAPNNPEGDPAARLRGGRQAQAEGAALPVADRGQEPEGQP